MRDTILHIILMVLCFEISIAQESNAFIALELPVRNSLKFNRYVISPTLSYARETNRNFVINNKRELVQVGDAPQTYMASFSGKFSEKIGAGLGVFQRNFGVFTTFGGLLNFAYNAQLTSESNLTFGLNLAAYSSGINRDRVVSTMTDPALNDLSTNFLSTISPGINYGSGFVDVGLTVNNLVTYNISTSDILSEKTLTGIQGHVLYTGYIDSYNFFDNSRFSALGRAEFREDIAIYSGSAMLTVPKGFWIQGGYNTLFGASGGVGLNITSQIALEYNYERAIGNYLNFGASHEFTLAYILTKNKSSNFRKERIVGLLNLEKKRKRTKRKPTIVASNEDKEEPQVIDKIPAIKQQDNPLKALSDTEEQARLESESLARLEAEKATRLAAEAKARKAAQEQARLESESLARLEAEKATRLAAEAKARKAAQEQARLESESVARLEAMAAAAEKEEKEEEKEEEKLGAEADAGEQTEAQSKVLNPLDHLGQSMVALTAKSEDIQNSQDDLFQNLQTAVEVLNSDLRDLKEENDLRERGIIVKPKPFKSVTQEKARIKSLEIQLDEMIKEQNVNLLELEAIYNKRIQNIAKNDEVNSYYKDVIRTLKTTREQSEKTKINLVSSLKRIEEATEIERKRRIKRASYSDLKDRYQQDQARLLSLKESTPLATTPLTITDFDFGEPRSQNIQILKNVEHVENGYYVVLAVHTDSQKRDDFVKKVIASGHSQIQFFYDINTSKYYIYYESASSLQGATQKIESNHLIPFWARVSIIKIEN